LGRVGRREITFGRKVRKLLPLLAAMVEGARGRVLDWRAFYAGRLAAIEARGETVHAARCASLVCVGVEMLRGAPVDVARPSECSRCGRSLFSLAGEPLPLFLGAAEPAWFHPACLVAELTERTARARVAIAGKLAQDG
jgi:hypothetical protein